MICEIHLNKPVFVFFKACHYAPELPRLPIFGILPESSVVRDPTLHVLRAHGMKFTMPYKTVIQSHVAPRLPEMSRMEGL